MNATPVAVYDRRCVQEGGEDSDLVGAYDWRKCSDEFDPYSSCAAHTSDEALTLVLNLLIILLFPFFPVQLKREGWLVRKGFFGIDTVWVVLRGGVMTYSESPVKS